MSLAHQDGPCDRRAGDDEAPPRARVTARFVARVGGSSREEVAELVVELVE